MKWFILSVCFALCFANAQDMYVSSTGKGSSCTLASPCSIDDIETLHMKYSIYLFGI